MQFTPMSCKKPVFIVGSHKSGSSLLRSLLDGHPNLFSIPIETHYFQRTGHWVDYRLRYAWPQKMTQEEKISSLIELVRMRSSHKDPYADSNVTGKIDVECFITHIMNREVSQTPSGLFNAYVEALYYSIHKTEISSSTRFLEKSVENAEFAPTIRKMFPDCRFIHIVRNPYASIVAIRKSKTKKTYPYLRDYIFSIQNSLVSFFRNVSFLDHYMTVRYEDLLTETPKIMRNVSSFLEIPFVENLLKPTLIGESWRGNSSTGQQFKKISVKPLTSWQSQIYPFEIELVNSILGPVIEELGYEKMHPQRLRAKYFVAKAENAETYLKNRALLWLQPVVSKSP